MEKRIEENWCWSRMGKWEWHLIFVKRTCWSVHVRTISCHSLNYCGARIIHTKSTVPFSATCTLERGAAFRPAHVTIQITILLEIERPINSNETLLNAVLTIFHDKSLAPFSCVPKHMYHFVMEYTESDDGAVKNLKYRQFQFLDSNKVVLQYSVRFCSAEMSGECNKTVSSLS